MTIARATSAQAANVLPNAKLRLATFENIPFQDEAAEIALRIEELHRSYKSDGGYQDFLVRQLAVCSMRLDRSVWQEWSLLKYEARRAELVWDIDREAHAAELAERLPKKPEKISKTLEESLHGAQWKIERWEYLAKMAESGQAWSDQQRGSALDLIGQPLDVREVEFTFDGDAVSQARLARQEMRRLQAMIPRLTLVDEHERKLTIDGLSTEPSATMRSHRRFESQNARMLHRLLTELNRRRRQQLSEERPTASISIEPAPPSLIVSNPAPNEQATNLPEAPADGEAVVDEPEMVAEAPPAPTASAPKADRHESRRARRAREARERRRRS